MNINFFVKKSATSKDNFTHHLNPVNNTNLNLLSGMGKVEESIHSALSNQTKSCHVFLP